MISSSPAEKKDIIFMNMHLQLGIATIKMSSKKLKVFTEKQPDLFLIIPIELVVGQK